MTLDFWQSYQVIRWGKWSSKPVWSHDGIKPSWLKEKSLPWWLSFFVNIDIYLTCILFSLFLQTTFLQGLLGRNMKYLATMNKEHLPRYAINTVYIYGQERYLMVTGSNLYFAKIDNFFDWIILSISFLW